MALRLVLVFRPVSPLSGHSHAAGRRGSPTLSPGLDSGRHTSLELQSQKLFSLSVTLGALLSRLVRPIRERIWWYVRVGAVGWPVFEHCAVVLTPPGGGMIAYSPI